MHEEVGRSATHMPSTSLDLDLGVAITKSASSHTVEGVPGRVQDLNGISWADRGQGGSNQLGVTGRDDAPARPGVGGSADVPIDVPRPGVGGSADGSMDLLVTGGLLSTAVTCFFLEGVLVQRGREFVPGRL